MKKGLIGSGVLLFVLYKYGMYNIHKNFSCKSAICLFNPDGDNTAKCVIIFKQTPFSSNTEI